MFYVDFIGMLKPGNVINLETKTRKSPRVLFELFCQFILLDDTFDSVSLSLENRQTN